MTLKEFSNKVDLGTCLMGQFQVTINYRGKDYTCKSNNTQAYDAIRDWLRDADNPAWGYTPKQAYECLWSECKTANDLR